MGSQCAKKFSHSSLSFARDLTPAKLEYVNLTQMNNPNLEDERANRNFRNLFLITFPLGIVDAQMYEFSMPSLSVARNLTLS